MDKLKKLQFEKKIFGIKKDKKEVSVWGEKFLYNKYRD